MPLLYFYLACFPCAVLDLVNGATSGGLERLRFQTGKAAGAQEWRATLSTTLRLALQLAVVAKA